MTQDQMRCRILVGALLFLAEFLFLERATAQIVERKLLPGDGHSLARFGWEVSLSGDHALVGSPGDYEFSGSAYIFRREGNNWVQDDKLIASDGAPDDYFGGSVSLSGDYALVGACLDNDNGNNSGSAYIFRREGSDWVEEAKLMASDGASLDCFGVSVSLSGDYALVGANGDDDARGSAYIFRHEGNNWIEETKLIASDGAKDDWFGYSVFLSGDYAVMGATHGDDNGIEAGSAYVFNRAGTLWVEEFKLTASDGAPFDHFGGSVSLSGDHALVGANGDDDARGSAYSSGMRGTTG